MSLHTRLHIRRGTAEDAEACQQLTRQYSLMTFEGESAYNEGIRNSETAVLITPPLLTSYSHRRTAMATHDSSTPPQTVTIPLSKGYETIVDAVDADLATFKWSVKDCNASNIYAIRHVSRIDGKQIFERIHRVILTRMIGRPLNKDEQVDHIDGDGLNNRRSNLRIATAGQNRANQMRTSRNTSGFKGVSWNKGMRKWSAQICKKRVRVYLGYFDSPEDAYKAYCEAARAMFGEFANFGDGGGE